MKKYNFTLVFVLSLALFLTSFVFGYQMMGKKINGKFDTAKTKEEDLDSNEYSDMEILKEDNRISPNTFIEERVHYKPCGHVLTKLNRANEEIVNMTEKEYREYIQMNYPNIKIISYTNKQIVLREDRNHLCPNHYIIGEKEGNIAIFKVDERGQRILDKVFPDYPISLLKEIDQEKLKEGIMVDSEEELSDILENFIS